MNLHRGKWHCYHKKHNPSGCDKFYCLHRYRPYYYYWIGIKGWFR